MLDTGSMRSFISPKLAYKYFSQVIFNEPFQVVSTHASSNHDEVMVIDLPPTFQNPEAHKFYVFNVDSRYDGLIGNDLLTQLGAVIDYKHQVLSTNNVDIPIVINSGDYKVTVPARSEIRVKVPTDLHTGEGILNYTNFGFGVRMPAALVTCVNGYATTVLQST